MEPHFRLYQCDEFRLIQALVERLEGKHTLGPSSLQDTRNHWVFECELRRTLRCVQLRDQNLEFPAPAFTKVKEAFGILCQLLDQLVKPEICWSYAIHDPPEYPNLSALKRYLENPTPRRYFDMASGTNQTLFSLPQNADELHTNVTRLIKANDQLDLMLNSPSTLPSDVPLRVPYQDTTTRDHAAIVLNTLFQGFQCKNHKVMLGLGDHYNPLTGRERTHLWLSRCSNSRPWQEALYDSQEDGNLFDCSKHICNQLQEDSNEAKLLGLTIRGGDVFGTWNSPPSEKFSADPSSSISLAQLIRKKPHNKLILRSHRRDFALQLGYRLLDFFDAEWDSKNLHLIESAGSVDQGVLLYLTFSSGLPASRELLKFETGHPVLVSFAKILLEIHTGKTTSITTKATIAIRKLIYENVVSNLEFALKVGPSTRKRSRSESPVPNSTIDSETRSSRARDQSTSTNTPLAHPSIQLDANGDSEGELVAPQRKKRLAHSRGEQVLNRTSSGLPERSRNCSSASLIHFYGEASEISLHSNLREESARRMKCLTSIRDELLLSKTPHEDIETVRIAIIDTGIDTSHPYISTGYGPNGDEPASVQFHDFSEEASSIPVDEDGHGTFIAGIILQLMPNAIKCAVEWGADIMSMSFGFYRTTDKLHDAINFAINKQIIVLAAVGNSGNHQQWQYPANEDRVFKIFATDHLGYKVKSCPPLGDNRYSFGALGSDIESIWPLRIEPPAISARSKIGDPWTRMSGSSFSTPVAAAIVAIIFQFYYEYPTVMDVGEKLTGCKTIAAQQPRSREVERQIWQSRFGTLFRTQNKRGCHPPS
ncbi:hypothetical protein EMPG_13295 [Blastomyces silverae]|uniref:Peptidase S8/S53 domain-containing protein n=1 Tax=Blastomyces silverae TaxID=2060906 RepID=A0A0H1BJJ6_9EURO|nr:hypothetical protein EMPG_13295 [Blastomyces silverae]